MTTTLSRSVAPATDGLQKQLPFFYGWVMLPVATIGLISTSPGQTYGITVFNEPLREALSLTHSQLAAAYMLGTLLAATPIIFVGSLMDRFGLRKTMTVAVVLFGGACLFMSRADSWPTLLISFFLLRALGPGTLAFLSGNVVSFWFHRRLGLAEGVRQVGTAAAIAVVPALNLWLVREFGWRTAYQILGITVWVIMLPLMALLFRNRPDDVGQSLDGLPAEPVPFSGEDEATDIPPVSLDFTLQEAIRTRTFWIVVGGTGAFSMLLTAVFFSLVPIFLDRGLTEADAVGMLSGFAISLAGMHLIGGMLADRFPAPRMLATALILLGISLFTMRLMSTAWCGWLAGITMAISQGLYFGASGPLWARYFGRMHLGKIRGVLMTVNVGASSLGPLLVGVSRDLFGNHNHILTAFALVPIPLAALALLATPPIRQPLPEPEPVLAACTE